MSLVFFCKSPIFVKTISNNLCYTIKGKSNIVIDDLGKEVFVIKRESEKILGSKSFSYFLQLAETMNYTQAAQLLGITQPALTQQIKKLENNVGTPLFYSIGKQLHLTDAGETMVKTIESVYGLLLDASETIQKDSNQAQGKITIGISASVEDKVITDFIVDYFKSYPNVNVSLLMVSRKEVWEKLENSSIDMALIYLSEQLIKNPKSYETWKIIEDEILFLHHDPKLIHQTAVQFSETLNQPWVTYPEHYFVSQVILNAFKRQVNDIPESSAHFSKPSQMFKFSNATGMYTALPRSFFETRACDSKLKAVPFDPPIKLDLAFVIRQEKVTVPRIHHFLTAFENYLTDEDYISRLKINKKNY